MHALDADRLQRDLEAIFGPRRVSTRAVDLETYARDMWPRMLIEHRDGTPAPQRPYAVVWPEHVREIVALVKLAREQRIPIVPYGGGSGVCGGAVPLRGGITIDTKRMQQLRAVHADELICDVEAGLNGERFERELARRGYTFGNFPSSIYCSTVGGWLATRAAGQLSTKYGKVEDRVAGLTVVTGRGEIIETDGPSRALRGPSWTQLLCGSEGTLGIITSARLRVSPAPQLRVFRGFDIEDIASGVAAIRRVVQKGLRPAVVRLYDELDTLLNSFTHHDAAADHDEPALAAPVPLLATGALPAWPEGPAPEPSFVEKLVGLAKGKGVAGFRGGAFKAALGQSELVNKLFGAVERVARRGCRLVIGLEGARIRTEVEAALTFAELEAAGARDRGEDPGWSWYRHRYAVSYRMSPVFRSGAFVDTMEVAASWDRLLDLYHSVRAAIGRHAVVMAHFSHAYPDGCSIYFTFAGHAPDAAQSERIYDAVWRDGMEATTRVGGTISHHHGVGLLKAPYMAGEHREAMALFEAAKLALDPDGIFNPGKMGLRGRVR